MDAHRTRRRVVLALSGLVAVAAIATGAGIVSLALFTSTTNVTANFTTGTLTIGTSPASTLITFTAMAPGDQVTAPLTVQNTGSLDLRYAVSSSATNADGKGLKDQLVLTIKSGVTTCSDAAWGADGSVLYTGDLDGTTGLLIGNPATGADPGDRNLVAGASEVLCFNVTLPLSTGTAFQAATSTATFTFDAEQTKNN
jgi:spore coat-associated protein N